MRRRIGNTFETGIQYQPSTGFEIYWLELVDDTGNWRYHHCSGWVFIIERPTDQLVLVDPMSFLQRAITQIQSNPCDRSLTTFHEYLATDGSRLEFVDHHLNQIFIFMSVTAELYSVIRMEKRKKERKSGRTLVDCWNSSTVQWTNTYLTLGLVQLDDAQSRQSHPQPVRYLLPTLSRWPYASKQRSQFRSTRHEKLFLIELYMNSIGSAHLIPLRYSIGLSSQVIRYNLEVDIVEGRMLLWYLLEHHDSKDQLRSGVFLH